MDGLPSRKKFKKWRKSAAKLKRREAKLGFNLMRRLFMRKAELSLNMTRHELMVHRMLKKLKMKFKCQRGFIIDRQIVIVDFQVRKTILEIDGANHASPAQAAKDAIRDATLRERGYTVIRILNEEVEHMTPVELHSLILNTESGRQAEDERCFSAYCRNY